MRLQPFKSNSKDIGVIHGDIKPQNVLVFKDTVKWPTLGILPYCERIWKGLVTKVKAMECPRASFRGGQSP